MNAETIQGLLACPIVARTEHFVVHRAAAETVLPELSTAPAPSQDGFVDNPRARCSSTIGLGLVVPKRHARRSVTRNLIRRQIREHVRQRPQACGGSDQLLVRLRRGFDAGRFPSAASAALRQAVSGELAALLDQAARAAPPQRGGHRP